MDPVQINATVLDAVRAGRFAEVSDLFTPSLRSMVSAAAIEASWLAATGRLGAITAVGTPVLEPPGPTGVVVKTLLTFESGQLTAIVAIGVDGGLAGIQLASADAAAPNEPWQPPAYTNPDTFDEQDVTIGSGPLAVPGTLSIPRGSGPWPGVVLLAGSGPLDRDETVGRNKMFKDVAWGLASRGIAVVRFDKVTFAHRDRLADIDNFTVVDEYVHHAVAALDLLRAHPAIDAARVFIAGHSLGGTVAPRVAATDSAIAGLIILAGGAQPLHWAAVRQFRYLAALDPATAAAAQSTIERIAEQARMVDSPELSSDTPTTELPFGIPGAYWLDLRGYHPVTSAAALDRPMLILQGGRDYQVTVDDDLALWRAGLAGRPNVTIRVYDADNHMFVPGTGPSTPAEYEPVAHVDPTVISDIVAWLGQIMR